MLNQFLGGKSSQLCITRCSFVPMSPSMTGISLVGVGVGVGVGLGVIVAAVLLILGIVCCVIRSHKKVSCLQLVGKE